MKQALLNLVFVNIVGFNLYYWYKYVEAYKEYNNQQINRFIK